MKQISGKLNRGNGGSPRKACRAFCRKVRAEIAGVKQAIFAESSRAFSAPKRLIRLALNEAEATAWQTRYPHLVFADLATEKVQAVAAWNARQHSVWQRSPVIALAA